MINTRLKENIEIINGRKLKDGAEKRILANRQILAYILKGTLSEFRDIPLKKIEEYLQDPIEISKENVLELKQEMIQNNNHKTSFDLHFIARKNEEVIEVNLEIQDRINPGYPLVKRGLVYCGVMLSSQLGSVITSSHYEKAHKVVTIWICLKPYKRLRGSIETLQMNRKGSRFSEYKDYDLIQTTFLFLGEGDKREQLNREQEEALKLCDTLFSMKLSAKEKIRILEEEYRIEMTENEKEEIEMTCDMKKYYYECGKENVTIELIKNLMKTSNVSITKAFDMLMISEEEREYYQSLLV